MGMVCLAIAVTAAPAPAQSDLDAFMARALARRDDNWRKLQQYVLEEDEAFDVTGPGGLPLYGFRRHYTWFIKQGYFVRSPVKADGVALTEAVRRTAEAEWIGNEKAREERRKKRSADTPTPPEERVDHGAPATVEDVLKQGVEPRFVSAAYFLDFKFEPGHYALAGRETLAGRPALRIEYYPQDGLFHEGRSRPNRRVRDRDEEIQDKMNKVSLVTLWVDAETHQILQYIFDNVGLDFLPGRTLARVDEMQATMRMAQPFPGVWLPSAIDMRFGLTLAVGSVEGTYRVAYHDYKQADVAYRIK